jgi:hypothetical protein
MYTKLFDAIGSLLESPEDFYVWLRDLANDDPYAFVGILNHNYENVVARWLIQRLERDYQLIDRCKVFIPQNMEYIGIYSPKVKVDMQIDVTTPYWVKKYLNHLSQKFKKYKKLQYNLLAEEALKEACECLDEIKNYQLKEMIRTCSSGGNVHADIQSPTQSQA